MVYNLKISKGFTRGIPNVCNDIMIRISQDPSKGSLQHPPALLREIARLISDALNSTYSFSVDSTDPRD